MKKATCPTNRAHKYFTTTIHVTQTVKVSETGDFIEEISSCDEVTHGPHQDNSWTCTECGADAVHEELVDIQPAGVETFVVVGYYRETGERFTDEIEATSANAAEDLAIKEHDDLVVVASFPKPAGDDVFQVNVDRCYVESANTKEGD